MFRRRFTSERVRKERRRSVLVRLALWVCLALACVALVWQVSRMALISIANVSVVGVKTVSTTEIFERVQSELQGTHWFLFPKRNVFFVRTKHIEAMLLAAYPRFARVDIDRVGFTKLHVAVTEREPRSLWCDGGTCYFMDSSGFVYIEAPTFKYGSAFVTYSGGDVNVTAPVGSVFLPREDFYALALFIEDLSVAHLETTAVRHLDDRIAIRVVPLMTDGRSGSFEVYVSATSSYVVALQDFTTITSSDEFKAEVSSLSDLEYIDLRFGNKVFYKKKANAVEFSASDE